MIYEEEIRKKQESILKAFEHYIGGQNFFDIVYSSKNGYLMIDSPSAGCAEQLDTPEKMLGALFNEVINDVVFSPENTARVCDNPSLTKWEEAEVRRRLTNILKTAEDGGAEYLDFLDAYIKSYQERCR